jgi:hypothetical protein
MTSERQTVVACWGQVHQSVDENCWNAEPIGESVIALVEDEAGDQGAIVIGDREWRNRDSKFSHDFCGRAFHGFSGDDRCDGDAGSMPRQELGGAMMIVSRSEEAKAARAASGNRACSAPA